MTTNFFERIDEMKLAADLRLTISKDSEGIYTIAALLCNDKVGDNAKHTIPPMLFQGTAAELDEGFFDKLTPAAKKVDGLFVNMEQYLKQVEEAQLQSKMERDKNYKESKGKDERKTKFDAAMKKVDELEQEDKIQHAIACLPKEKDFPEQAEEIKLKLESLRKKNQQSQLFQD